MLFKHRRELGLTGIELIVLIALVVIVMLAIQNCPGQQAVYKPPIVPVKISVNSDGEIRVGFSGEIVTPVGTFSAEWEERNINYLEVTLGQQTRFYPLGKEKFTLDLPNTLEGTSRVTWDGEGNVRVLVPAPGNLHFPALEPIM